MVKAMQNGFDPILHQYWLDGKIVPGITQVLSPYNHNEFSNSRAMERGTNVHLAITFIESRGGAPFYHPNKNESYLSQWINAKDYLKFGQPLLTEHPLISRKWQYGGTPDILFESAVYKGKQYHNVLIEIKTGTRPDTAEAQLAAQAKLIELETEFPLPSLLLSITLTPTSFKIQRHNFRVGWGDFRWMLYLYNKFIGEQ